MMREGDQDENSPGVEASWLAEGFPPQLLPRCTVHLGKLIFVQIVARIGYLDGQVVPVGGARGCVPSK